MEWLHTPWFFCIWWFAWSTSCTTKPNDADPNIFLSDEAALIELVRGCGRTTVRWWLVVMRKATVMETKKNPVNVVLFFLSQHLFVQVVVPICSVTHFWQCVLATNKGTMQMKSTDHFVICEWWWNKKKGAPHLVRSVIFCLSGHRKLYGKSSLSTMKFSSLFDHTFVILCPFEE